MERNVEIENQIKQIFKQYKQIKNKIINNEFNKNNIIKQYCINLLQQYPEYLSILNLIYAILHNIELPHCKMCNKLMKYTQRNGKYCSQKCSSTDPQNIKKGQIKFKQTCLKKFGTQTPLTNDKCKQKGKQTILKKYGVQNVMQNQQVKEKVFTTMREKYGQHSSKNKNVIAKRLQTNNKKYGGNAPICSQKIKQKIQNTMIKKYNGKTTSLSPILKQKTQNTCFKKYGNISPFGNKKIQEKSKQTILQKYNVKHVLQCETIKNKVFTTNIKKYGSKTYCQSREYLENQFLKLNNWSQYIIPLFTKEEYEGFSKFKIYKWQCVKCGNIFQQALYGTTFMSQVSQFLPRCPHCFPKNQPYSKQQKQLAEFCKEYFSNLSQNNFKIISPYELDIYISQINLALQFNGNFWHQINTEDPHGVQPGYHLMKTKLCNQKNIRLIHIWQDEWLENKQQIKQKLKLIFKKQQVIPTNCQIDFSWFNNIDLAKYIIKQEKPSILVERNRYLVENCGTIILQKR